MLYTPSSTELPGSSRPTSHPLRVVKPIFQRLFQLFDQATILALKPRTPVVLFSDLHIGDGSGHDDFKRNAHILESAARDFYYRRGYHLVLNGDIEEALRFQLPAIYRRYTSLYTLFDQYRDENRLIKLPGNHDERQDLGDRYPLYDAIRFEYQEDPGYTIFVYHGDLADTWNYRSRVLTRWMLRNLANLTPINNFYRDYRSIFRLETEENLYMLSVIQQIVSIIGHTHRPLFETLSKPDYLKHKINALVAEYKKAKSERQAKIRKRLDRLERVLVAEHLDVTAPPSSIYSHSAFTAPHLFNIGSGISPHGVTGIEIHQGVIALVLWYDQNTSKVSPHVRKAAALENSSLYRVILRQAKLSDVFNRIELLGKYQTVDPRVLRAQQAYRHGASRVRPSCEGVSDE